MRAAIILEISSIAKGYLVLDQSLKAGKVHTIEASPVSPGKFLIMLKGPLAEIEKSYRASLESAKDYIIDSALIPEVRDDILEALYGLSKAEAEASGITVFETHTLSTMLHALHNALTKTSLKVLEVRSGRGIGGKSTAFISGDEIEMKNALEAFLRTAKPRDGSVEGQLISKPHKDFLSYFRISE